jgi:hypothetical protein
MCHMTGFSNVSHASCIMVVQEQRQRAYLQVSHIDRFLHS